MSLMTGICLAAVILQAISVGWVYGHERGRRRGLRDACRILAGSPVAGQSAANWLAELERKGEL